MNMAHVMALTGRTPRRPLTPIIEATARASGLTLEEIRSVNRHPHIARPRQVAAALCRELTDATQLSIAYAVGWSDHTTVRHALKAVKARMTPELAAAMDAIRAEVTR